MKHRFASKKFSAIKNGLAPTGFFRQSGFPGASALHAGRGYCTCLMIRPRAAYRKGSNPLINDENFA